MKLRVLTPITLLLLTGCDSYWFDPATHGPVKLLEASNPARVEAKEVFDPQRTLFRSADELYPEVQSADGLKSGDRVAFWVGQERKWRAADVWKIFRNGPATSEEREMALKKPTILTNPIPLAPGILVTVGEPLRDRAMSQYYVRSTETVYRSIPSYQKIFMGRVWCTRDGTKFLVEAIFKKEDSVLIEAKFGHGNQNVACDNSAFTFSVAASQDGVYNYSISQMDSFGAYSPSVHLQWIRDTQAPEAVAFTAPGLSPFTSGDSVLNLQGSCETGTVIHLSGADSQIANCAASNFGFAVNKAKDGNYDFKIVAVDNAGNSSEGVSFSWIRDTSIPASPVLASPASSVIHTNGNEVSIQGSCIAGYTVDLDGDADFSMTCPNSGNFVMNISDVNQDDSYSYSVTQTNEETGMTSAPVSFEWVRMTAVPSAPVIISPVISPYASSGSFSIAGSCTAGQLVQLSGDDAQVVNCASNQTFGFTVSKKVDGAYSFQLKQVDLAGNASSAVNLNWQKNSGIPAAPAVLSPSVASYPSNGNQIVVSGSCNNGYVVVLSGDVSSYEVTGGKLAQYCTGSSFSFVVNKSRDGSYAMQVAQQSGDGSQSGGISVQWVRDTRAPVVAISSAPVSPNLQSTASFAFGSDEAGVVYSCSLNSAAFANCASPLNMASVPNGNNTLQVRATDAAGNVSKAASVSWTQQSANTLALYHFDSPTLTTDSSLLAGSYHNNLVTNSGTSAVNGAFKQGLNLTTSSAVAAPMSSSLAMIASGGKLTAEARVKFSITKTYSVLMSQSAASPNFSWEVRLQRESNNRFKVRFVGSSNGRTTRSITTPAMNLDTSKFYHVAVTFNMGEVRIFVDGAQKASGTIGSVGKTKLFTNQADFRVGQGASTSSKYRLTGVVDELRLSQIIRYTGSYTVPAAAFNAD